MQRPTFLVPVATTVTFYREPARSVHDEHVEARAWLERAARQGGAAAALLLARFHEHGLGTDVDDQAAMTWALVAARFGHPSGPAQVGRLAGRLGDGAIAEAGLAAAAICAAAPPP